MDHRDGASAHSESLERAIANLSERQYGLFSRAQASELGMSRRQIDRRLGNGRWDSPLPKVLRVIGSPSTAHQRAMAAMLWAGDGSLVSHAAAAVLWCFEGVRARKVELWTTRSLRSELVVVHRGIRLDRADRAMLGPIPITTPVRTLIDMAGRLDDLRLSALTESLIKRGLVDPDRVPARLDALRASGRPGAGRLAALLDVRGDGPAMESMLEALVWSLILESGVRIPERQHWVDVPGGRYRLDYAWPDLHLGMECDSWEHHGANKSDFGKDRARYAELVVVGYRVLPVTWDVAKRDPRRVIRWLRTAFPEAA